MKERRRPWLPGTSPTSNREKPWEPIRRTVKSPLIASVGSGTAASVQPARGRHLRHCSDSARLQRTCTVFADWPACVLVPSRPREFHPEPSLIRTGYSRIIRLVPSREGCRLPLNEGLLPANQLAQISGDDLRSSPITGPTSLLRGGPPFDQLPPLTCQTTIRSRPTGVTLNFLKAAASAVSRVGAITDPSSMLGLPIRYTNQSSVSAGSPMSEF
jgi:hypothetical protein